MKLVAIAAICAGLLLAGCGGGDSSSGSSTASSAVAGKAVNVGGPGPEFRLPPGPLPKKVAFKDLKKGTGPEAKVGDEAFIRYVGIRWNGETYSNSWSFKAPPSFVLGAHELTIGGLETSIEGMRVGGRREIFLPPSAHIRQSVKNETPAEARENTLAYMVDLVKVVPQPDKLRALRALTGR